ncbi:unnamed protein product [Orchesella dallaii]|uniref:G-protein coupled receptors family 2 profile 2 domain-containing protein n=1 Tax=Orchesella dallaii TaxID=48710 RepID=A0ABP1QHI2_9HEXA
MASFIKNYFHLPYNIKMLHLHLLLLCLLNQACAQIFNMSLPKCRDSLLGDEVQVPSILISPQDLKNRSASETVPVKLTASHFHCEPKTGRVATLQVSLADDSQDLTEVLTLFQTGNILHDKTYFSKEEFCLHSITQADTVTVSVKICEPRCSSGGSACVQKCCQPGKVWDLQHYDRGNGKLSCEASGPTSWHPFLYMNKYDKLNATQATNVQVRYMEAHPKNFCDGGFFLMTLKDYDGIDASPFRILKDGNVVMKIGRNSWERVPKSVYCVDGAMNFKSENETQQDFPKNIEGGYSGDEADTVMLVCTDFLADPDTSLDGTPNLMYVIAMMVASVFLFLTALVYLILWKRQSIHGWTFLGYVVSLLLTFVFLSLAHLMSAGESDCSFIGIACHFFFLSTFAWLTALNFDIYWTFRSMNPNPGRSKEAIRFLCYSIFAIGLPVIIVSVGLILDEIYGDDPESEVIVPRYGVSRCTMDRQADLPYLFGPISVLLACNLILFPTTLYYIYKSQKMAKMSGMKSNMLKHKIRFFGKIFMLAGVTWIFEVISWACTEPGKPLHWIWKLLDLVNILQAIAIFVVFVCNRKTLKELSEKFSCLERMQPLSIIFTF